MTNTPNKNLERPAHGADVDSWDVNLNSNFTITDSAFGGSTTLNATGASGNVSFTQSQATPPTIIVSGVPVGAVNYQLPSGIGGTWIVSNNTTGGFAITFESLGGGSTVTILPGINTPISCDGTSRGMVYSAQLDPQLFALNLISTKTANNTGTTLAWTGLDSTYTNYMLIVQGIRAASFISLQFGTGGGPTWLTSGYYHGHTFNNLNSSSGSTISGQYTQNAAGIPIDAFGLTTNLIGMNATYDIYNVPSLNGLYTSTTLRSFSVNTSNPDPTTQLGLDFAGGVVLNGTAKTAIRLISDSGNLIDGTASLYGYRP